MKRSLCALLGLLVSTQAFAKEETPQAKVSPLGKLTEYTQGSEQAFTIKTANEIKAVITFYRDNTFRLQAAPKGDFKDPHNNPDKAQILVIDKPAKSTVSCTKNENALTFRTPKLTLTFDIESSTFSLAKADGTLLWKELEALSLSKQRTIQTLSTSDDEHFFGGGQQNGYFTHKGTKIDIVADGNWDEGGHPSPAPFYMSTKGYGVLRNTFSVGAYDFTHPTKITLEHKENRFDAYYFVADDFKGVLDLYTQFTGRPNFVPRWALYLGEADAYMTRDKETKELVKNPDGTYVETTPDVIDRLAKKYREHDFPAGWILPNDGYGCGYVKLPYVVEELDKLGFKTGLWTENVLDKTEWEVGTAGIRAQKLDVAYTGPAYQFSLDANHQAWTSIEDNSDSRGFVWTVQGWAGTQRYSVCWTGDQYGTWDLIRYHIPTLIGSGLSGQAYATTDVDGIFGGSPETYTRDLQWKCFTPVLYVMNGWANDISKSPFDYPERYRDINRNYLKLKSRLNPYMYTLCKQSLDTGTPIVRGMMWEFPDNPKHYDRTTQHQFMLGSSLLIAPIYTSEKINNGWRREPIHLPKGTWVDYWDGRRIDGGSVIENYPAPLEKLPILVRAGAIIPMYPETLYDTEKPKTPITWDIYPHGDTSYTLYEDDGWTRRYEKGESSTQTVTVHAPEMTEAGDITVLVSPVKGEYKGQLKKRAAHFRIHTEAAPQQVIANGSPLTKVNSKKELAAIDGTWFYDQRDKRGIAYINLATAPITSAIKLELKIDASQVIAASPAYPQPEISPDIDKTRISAVASSQSKGTPINNAFDGTDETFWHSNYSKDGQKNYPYEIVVRLGDLYALNAFEYLPRHNGGNGLLKDYEIYVSRSAESFPEKPVAKGAFRTGTELQVIDFDTTWGEYVKLRFLSAQNGEDHLHAAAAEFGFKQDLQAEPLADEIAYLSDLKPASSKGKFNMDKSIGGMTITVNDLEYKKGIGVSSPSELVYELDGSWDMLSGHVGMDDEVGDAGSVMFRVYGDDKLLFESPSQTGKSIKQLMKLNVKGVKQLRLVLLDDGDGSENDHADWVDAKLVRKGSK